MLKPTEAKRFAEDWIRDWNSHDMDAILSHYADDFEKRHPRSKPTPSMQPAPQADRKEDAPPSRGMKPAPAEPMPPPKPTGGAPRKPSGDPCEGGQ